MDELVYSVYLSSELIVIDTQTVDGSGVLQLTHLDLPVKGHHLVAYLADVYRLLPALSLNGERSNTGSTARSVPRVFYSAKRLVLPDSCCFGFEQHLGRWAVFSAAFHHAQQPDGRVAHNQKP